VVEDVTFTIFGVLKIKKITIKSSMKVLEFTKLTVTKLDYFSLTKYIRTAKLIKPLNRR